MKAEIFMEKKTRISMWDFKLKFWCGINNYNFDVELKAQVLVWLKIQIMFGCGIEKSHFDVELKV